MNIYEKLQNMRVELQQKNIKKSGKNKFAGYDYYELSDILPPINELQAKYKTCSYVTFSKEEATLTIVNAEQLEEKIEFTSPMAELTLKGTHPIQNLGGIETYQRRYLYMTAWEIVENDYFDSVQGKETPKKSTPASKSLTQKTSSELNQSITEYSEIAQKPIVEINKELIKIVNKQLKTITEEEGQKLLVYLNECIEKAA